METTTNIQKTPLSQMGLKQLMNQDVIKKKVQELLGDSAQGFTTSVLQIVSNNKLLEKADPISVYNSALTSAVLKLPLNNNLGYAYIVPYGRQAQFQIGYKGLIQLAQRTGQYLAINAVEVYENQFKSFNALTEELDADFTLDGEGEIVGFASYFKLVNGFTKTVFWSKAKVEAHGKKFSKTFSSGSWKTDFNAMAKKTVLKTALSHYGILSIEMQQAQVADQAVIKDVTADGIDVEYPDNDGKEPLPALEDLDGAKESIRLQMVTLDQLKDTYTLTEKQEKELAEVKI